MNRRCKRVVSIGIAGIYLVVYGLQVPLFAQESRQNGTAVTDSGSSTGDRMILVDPAAQTKAQPVLPETVDRKDGWQEVDGDRLADRGADTAASRLTPDKISESGYGGGGSLGYQGARRGVAAASASGPPLRKKMVDTISTQSESAEDTLLAGVNGETSVADPESSAVKGGAPALRLTTKGKIVTGVLSAFIAGGVAALIYVKMSGAATTTEKERIPPPPAPPGI